MAVTQDISQGRQSSLGLAATTLIKAGIGRVARVSVTTAGAAGALYDWNATTGESAANLIAVIPAAVGVVTLDWPFNLGLLYVPGAAQVASISWT